MDGAIDITVSGSSSGNFVYQWRGPNNFSATSEDISGLNPGTYSVMIEDGCSMTEETFTLVDCSQRNIDIQGSTQVACPDYDVGRVEVTVSGGEAPYRYRWSNGSQEESLRNLEPGYYNVTIADVNGCYSEANFLVDEEYVRRGTQKGDRCNYYCGEELVENDGIENKQISDLSCSLVETFCTQTEQIIDEEISEVVPSYDDFFCRLSWRNVLLDRECPGTRINGINCRSCIFTQVVHQGELRWINCEVDFCYFPTLDISIVNATTDYNQFIVAQDIANGTIIQ